MNPQRDAILTTLSVQRAHVVGILEGLSNADMRRRVLPSQWNCVGLLSHLAVDVERFWFRAVVANEAAAWDSFDILEGSAWQVDDDRDPSQILELYRDEIDRADAVISATPLDAPLGRWPEELFGAFRLADLQQVMLHVIAETACHAGHLDAVRELIDGRCWMVL